MGAYNIIAGTEKQIKKGPDDWLIIDIGNRSRNKSCGVWYTAGKLETVHFGRLKKMTLEIAKDDGRGPLNMVIEAPLSLAKLTNAKLTNGNSARRPCDTYPGHSPKDWHHGPGATTLVAALLVLRDLHEYEQRRRQIRLFEGHVAFKTGTDYITYYKDAKTHHEADALALKDAIFAGRRREIFTPDRLRATGLKIESPFPFFDRALIPPVIRVNPIQNPADAPGTNIT